jgi:hypothetical protein
MLPHFRGTPFEDPYLHIRDFFDLCKTQNIHGLTPEHIRLILFPFSLKDNAKLWLNSLAAGSINNWEELATKFLKKFFPAQRTRQLRREIQTFQQKDGDLSSRHGSTSMSYLSNVHITTYPKKIRYKHFMKV